MRASCRDVLVLFLDQIAARLRMKGRESVIAPGPDAPAKAGPCLEDPHRGAAARELPGGAESGQTRARDRHAYAAQAVT